MNESIQDTPLNGDEPTLAASKRTLESNGSSKRGDRSKRIRVSRACDQCRAGREKCDGDQPACLTCLAQSRNCTYNEQPKKRGIQPNYIRTLELTLAWLLQKYPDNGRALSQRLPDSMDLAHRIIAFKDISASDALHQDWRNGIIYRQIDQLLSGAEIEMPARLIAGSDAPDDGGPSGGLPYHSPPLSAPSDAPYSIERQEERLVENNPSWRVEDIPSSSEQEVLKLPSAAWSLLEHYFAFTQTFMPITEKSDLLKLMYSYPSSGLPRNEALAPEHAELWSVMAWSALPLQADDSEFHVCHSNAKSLVHADTVFELSHVKALLVLTLIEIAKSSWATAWLTVGSAIRMLTHITAGKLSEPSSFTGRTKHSILAAFLLESLISSRTGAVPHLSTEMVQDVGLVIEDGIEEWSPWSDPAASSSSTAAKSPARSISTFNKLVRIALRNRATKSRDRGNFGIVMKLLQNASAAHSRENPSILIRDSRLPEGDIESYGSEKEAVSSRFPSDHTLTRSSHLDFWDLSNETSAMNQHHPFMSVPNDGMGSLTGEAPAQAIVTGLTPNQWTADSSLHGDVFGFVDVSSNTMTGADVFEELAMLDRTETQNPKFMQNLGFGPDLDLAEFFGEDYQPSDPLLAYIQATAPHGSGHPRESSGKDTG